ncbi:unnamed protein product [Allacma fusca]|uniref:Glucose-methanol-choline oxidoreductase N-terminal domain-containing protein n=1 Tax=Allacma fusca TaxID=39272 RepID=A0A8J2Q5G8_9HEXA|nr:unnamed protein product [Allacma fusca]
MEFTRYPQFDWMHETVPQKHAGLGLNNKVSFWPRGKVLGGSSTLNFMLYLRGHPKDYDNWAKITNDSEWNYENVLPYFKKSLKTYNGKYKLNKKHYTESPDGFLNVEKTGYSAFLKEFIDAGKELGYPEIDANGPQTEGFGPLEVTQLNSERYGTYAAIIKQLYYRDSVKILTYAQAVKIKLDKAGRAIGVYYHRHGERKYAGAKKEIIISAGSVDSPKLLMLSGIGPRNHLKAVGIKPEIDLPVGQNLEDHLVTSIEPFTAETDGVFASLDKEFGPGYIKDYIFHRKGLLTVAAGTVAQGFLCSENILNNNSKKCEWPDLQVYFSPFSYFRMVNSMVGRAMNFNQELLEEINPPTEKEGFHFLVSVVRPSSKGEITLKSNDPFALPIINPKYLEDPKDLVRMLQGLKLLLKIAENTTSFQQIGAKYTGSPIPGCKNLEFRSDDYWKCYLRQLSVTMWHPTGTCKMGPGSSDKTAVVDSKLRVLHTRGLRVADASIMPSIVNANTNAPSIMIGEKAAAFILQYWADQSLVSNKFAHYLLYQNIYKCFYLKV